MTETEYIYEENSRRPLTIAALALGLAAAVFAAKLNAPWWLYLPVGGYIVMCGWMVLFNRKSGMRLQGTDLSFYSGSLSRSIPCATISAVRVSRWSDGAPTITLMMKDGKGEQVPGMCFGNWREFTAALNARGIAEDQT